MILPKRQDGFFPEREDLPLLEVTAETGLWDGLLYVLSLFLNFMFQNQGFCTYKKEFILLFRHFYQSLSISYIEIVVHFVWT